MEKKIQKLLDDIRALKNNLSPENTLPENTYYLNDDEIVCMGDTFADARHPYEMDGMNLWAHANGCIDACESRFVFIRQSFYSENAPVDFFGGLKTGEDEWFPVSILGVHKQLSEPVQVDRYTVFGKRAAYYIADTERAVFAVRANITSEKQVNFTATAINKTADAMEIYLAPFIHLSLDYTDCVTIGTPMGRYGTVYPNGSYKFLAKMDIDYYAVVNRKIVSHNPPHIESTVSKRWFVGDSRNTLTNARSLRDGHITKQVRAINASDTPVVADMIRVTIDPRETVVADYLASLIYDEATVDAMLENEIDLDAIERDISQQEALERENLSSLQITFGDMTIPSINKTVFNRFLKNVQKQVNLCALGKNYVGEFIGVRDVFQQLDTSIYWNPATSKAKIVQALNYIFSDGRAPRQFSVPPKEGMIPAMDIREFIDQGVWVIETVYNYISVTGDYSILDEKCSYYDMVDENKGLWKKGETTTVLEHLTRIMDYLLSSIAPDTHCLRIKYGDWNDAINGLGTTKEAGKRFGDGVSVMATLQLYRNLKQMTELLTALGGYDDICARYVAERAAIEHGLETHALVDSADHGTHIVHGWGDKLAYKVCTPNDFDGQCRYSSTAYSFWCICGMLARDPALKANILHAYEQLDSKYGIRTITPHFEPDGFDYVGRIVKLTPGTYENCCAYIHATMFAAMAMFMMGESERAWAQIEKAIPITHSFITKTPFVMPNSYCYNEEYCLDGESMGDWYTGSGCVLLRNIIKHVFGIQPDLGGMTVCTAAYMPTGNAQITLNIKGCTVDVLYRKTGADTRKYVVNGVERPMTVDALSQTPMIYITNDELIDTVRIEVID